MTIIMLAIKPWRFIDQYTHRRLAARAVEEHFDHSNPVPEATVLEAIMLTPSRHSPLSWYKLRLKRKINFEARTHIAYSGGLAAREKNAYTFFL